MSMEFENGTWTSHGPIARAEDNERKVTALKKENEALKRKIADMEHEARRKARRE